MKFIDFAIPTLQVDSRPSRYVQDESARCSYDALVDLCRNSQEKEPSKDVRSDPRRKAAYVDRLLTLCMVQARDVLEPKNDRC
jgi:hypothetical protein